MKMGRRTWLATAPIAILAGCVPVAMGPTVMATPGPGKPPVSFASDQAACMARANQQLAPVVQAVNNQVAGAAFLNVMTGAGPDAVSMNAQATATAQQQYDSAYAACMYAMGDDVPPNFVHPVYYAEPAPTHRAQRHVVHKRPAEPVSASSPPASGAPAAPGFVTPAPTAPAAGPGFVTPAPAMTTAAGSAASSGQFATPPARQ